jgi:hypothetical protein
LIDSAGRDDVCTMTKLKLHIISKCRKNIWTHFQAKPLNWGHHVYELIYADRRAPLAPFISEFTSVHQPSRQDYSLEVYWLLKQCNLSRLNRLMHTVNSTGTLDFLKCVLAWNENWEGFWSVIYSRLVSILLVLNTVFIVF